MFLNKFPHLAAVFSARGKPNMSTSLDFTDKPVQHYQLFPHSCSVGSSSYRKNKFFIPLPDRIRSWQVPSKFSSEFSLNSYHRICIIKFQQTEWFFKLSPFFSLCCILVGRDEITSQILSCSLQHYFYYFLTKTFM